MDLDKAYVTDGAYAPEAVQVIGAELYIYGEKVADFASEELARHHQKLLYIQWDLQRQLDQIYQILDRPDLVRLIE